MWEEIDYRQHRQEIHSTRESPNTNGRNMRDRNSTTLVEEYRGIRAEIIHKEENKLIRNLQESVFIRRRLSKPIRKFHEVSSSTEYEKWVCNKIKISGPQW
jgi:hypothetical protein